MTNQAIEARIMHRLATMQQQREQQLKTFITVGMGQLAAAVKHDIKQLIDRQTALDEKLNILATHHVEHIQQLEKRVAQLEQRLTMVAGSGNNFPEQTRAS